MIDHIEVRTPDPKLLAETLQTLFDEAFAKETTPGVWEVYFKDGNAFLEIKVGDPNPVGECTRALSRLALAIIETDTMLPKILRLDPNAEDLGWTGRPTDQRRIVRFSIGNLLCHTIERRVMVSAIRIRQS